MKKLIALLMALCLLLCPWLYVALANEFRVGPVPDWVLPIIRMSWAMGR